MYITLKYDYSNDERIILGYKISNDINDILPILPSKTDEIIARWPGDYIHQYIVFIDYNRVNQVNNKFYNEAIKLLSKDRVSVTLAKQCVREYNLIKILEK